MEKCLPCDVGSFANKVGSTKCIKCEIGDYSDSKGQEKCSACPGGMITPALGATSIDMCVNPTPNFATGTVTLGIVVLLIYIVVMRDSLRYQAHEKLVHVVKPIVQQCSNLREKIRKVENLKGGLIRLGMRQNARNSGALQVWYSIWKVISFLLICFLFICLFCFAYYVSLMYQILYAALILWRGISSLVVLPPIIPSIELALVHISFSLRIPPILFEVLLYPFSALFKYLSTISFDLVTITVTCEGAKAPIKLMLNLLVLSVAASFISSGYQFLWNITLPIVNQTVFNAMLIKRSAHLENINVDEGDNNLGRKKRKNVTSLWEDRSKLYACLIGTMFLSLNPFQSVLRYLMTFVSLADFIENNGVHRISPACNHIAGSENWDMYLGYTSSLIAWYLFLPIIYMFSEILVPKAPYIRGGKIDRNVTLDSTSRKWWQVVMDCGLPPHVEGLIPPAATQFYHQQEEKRLKQKELSSNPKRVGVIRKTKEVIGRYIRYIVNSILAILSVDLWIILLAKYWMGKMKNSYVQKKKEREEIFIMV